MSYDIEIIGKSDDHLRVMGIDPSTTNLGVCVIDVNLKEPSKFKLVDARTLYGEKMVYDIPLQFDDTGDTGVGARTFGLARSLGKLIDMLNPDTGICEDNFLGMSALTFKQLIQAVSLIREEFSKRDIHLSYVLPNLAKEVVGANFRGTQKEDVKKGVIGYRKLDSGNIQLELLDEHAIDAVAVTLFRCEIIANNFGVWNGR